MNLLKIEWLMCVVVNAVCSGSLVTTIWRVLWLGYGWRWMSPDVEGTCKYTEYAVEGSRHGVVLQLEGWAEKLTAAHGKIPACYEMLQRASDLASYCEYGHEPSGSIKGCQFID
jgi:hypothetical protein